MKSLYVLLVILFCGIACLAQDWDVIRIPHGENPAKYLGGMGWSEANTNYSRDAQFLTNIQNTTILTNVYWPRRGGWTYGWADFTNMTTELPINTVRAMLTNAIDISTVTNSDGSAAVPDGSTYVDLYMYAARSYASGGGLGILNSSNGNDSALYLVPQVANFFVSTSGRCLVSNKLIYCSGNSNLWTSVGLKIIGAGK